MSYNGHDPYNHRPVRKYTMPTDVTYLHRSSAEAVRTANVILAGTRLALDEDQPTIRRKVVPLRK